MAEPVFLTGGSGFVGSAVIAELVSRGYPVKALANRKPIDVPGVESVRGSVTDPDAVRQGMKGCAAVIHLVGIIMEDPSKGITFERMHFEATKLVVDAARENGIARRYVQMSAMGTRAGALSRYHQTKWKAEEYVRASGLDWTILRPSMIHGPGGFMAMAAKWARRQAPPFVAMPYFGAGLLGRGGAGKLQPVYVGDVARAFADALEKPQTIHHTYDLGGPDVLTWPAFLHAASKAIVGRARPTLPVPTWYANLLTRIAPAKLLPFNRDQVLMSQEDNTGDITPTVHDFGWQPRALEPTFKDYADKL